jgi:AcrR family transcriptional regulator
MKAKDPKKERALFDAALVVADREGLEALTVQKVARQAGLAVGTLYVYFDGKEDLLRRLYLRTKAAAGDRMLEGYCPGLPFRQAFRRICHNQFEFLVEHRLEVGFQAKFYRSGFADDQTRALARTYTEAVEALVLRGQEEELVRPWEPGLVLRFVLAVLKEAAADAGSLSPEARAVLADQAADFCLAGLSP